MPTISDEVFSKLRASVSSAMQFSKGLQRYVLYAQTEASRLQGEISSLSSTQPQLRASVQAMRTQKGELDQAIEDLKKDKARLENTVLEQTGHLNEIKGLINETGPILSGLQGQAQKLRERGYTDQIVSKLLSSDSESGGEMLKRVQTLEGYKSQILNQQYTLNDVYKRITTAKEQQTQLYTELQSTNNEVAKVGNHLLRRQEEERIFEASLKITKALKETYGLSDQDFDNMWNLVRKFGAERLPGRTMANMKTAFQHYPTLLALETGIEQLESRHRHLQEVTDVLDKIDGRVAGNRYLTTLVAMINGHWSGLDPTVVVKVSKEFIHNLSDYADTDLYFRKNIPGAAIYLTSLNNILVWESTLIGLKS